MRSLSLVAILASLGSLCASAPTPEEFLEFAHELVQRAPPEANATLKSVNTTGTGCAGNSGSFIISDSAVMSFDDMVVTPTTPVKTCTIEIDLQLDPKWKYTINTATTIRGYVENLDRAEFSATYSVGKTPYSISYAYISLWNAYEAPEGTTYTKSGISDIGAAKSECGGGFTRAKASLQYFRTLANQTSAIATVDSMDIGFAYEKC